MGIIKYVKRWFELMYKNVDNIWAKHHWTYFEGDISEDEMNRRDLTISKNPELDRTILMEHMKHFEILIKALGHFEGYPEGRKEMIMNYVFGG